MPPRCTKATIGVASIDDQFARSGHNISGLFGVRRISVDGQIHGQFGYVTKHGEALPAQITTQPGRGTEVPFFRVVFRYLAIAALSFFGLFDPGKITHREMVVPGQKPPSLCPRYTGF